MDFQRLAELKRTAMILIDAAIREDADAVPELGRFVDSILNDIPIEVLPKKFYVSMCQDRHCEPEAKVFSTAEKAINHARELAKTSAYSVADLDERQVTGWLYHCQYSCEGDMVWVVEVELDCE